jgi:hypothetical protein
MGLLIAIVIAGLLLSTLTLLASATWDLLHQLRIRARWAVPLALGLGHLASQGDLVVLGALLGAARILDVVFTRPA